MIIGCSLSAARVQRRCRAAMILVTLVLSLGKNADEIPRYRTPGPGPWPQNGVTGCGTTGLPPTDILQECTEPLHPSAPDLRGFWIAQNGATGSGTASYEHIEMCGSRWIDKTIPVTHDHLDCNGTLAGGTEDYSAPNIVNSDGMCTPITTAGKFETDAAGNKCVNLYTAPFGTGLVRVVTRCLQPNGSMVWTHPLLGTTLYEKVAAGQEPNCVTCPDGQQATSVSDVLNCGMAERIWKRCVADAPCFPSTATVVMENGTRVSVATLTEGDAIVAATAEGAMTIDTVTPLSITKPNPRARRFITLTTSTNHSLRLTPEHHLPVGESCCANLKVAQSVTVGDIVWVAATAVRSGDAAVPSRVVSKVSRELISGVHSPVLLNGGFPVIDGIVTSFDQIEGVSLAAFGLPWLVPVCKRLGACPLLQRAASWFVQGSA